MRQMEGGQKAALRQAVRDRREQLDLSQEDLARSIGVSLRTYSRWELGQTKKDNMTHRLEQIASALDTTADSLIAQALVSAGHSVDRPAVGEDAAQVLQAAVDEIRDQLADLRLQVELVRSRQEALSKKLELEE